MLRIHQQVELCIDVMLVNSMKFLTTIAKKLQFRTAHHVPTKKHSDLAPKLVEAVSSII